MRSLPFCILFASLCACGATRQAMAPRTPAVFHDYRYGKLLTGYAAAGPGAAFPRLFRGTKDSIERICGCAPDVIPAPQNVLITGATGKYAVPGKKINFIYAQSNAGHWDLVAGYDQKADSIVRIERPQADLILVYYQHRTERYRSIGKANKPYPWRKEA